MNTKQILGLLSYPYELLLRIKFSLSGGGFLKIINYHDIAPAEFDLFNSQMTFLNEKYRFVGADILGDSANQKHSELKGINLLLTFDDGFKSNREAAERVLKPLGIKGIFFVCPDFMEITDKERMKVFIADNIFIGKRKPSQVPGHMAPMSWSDLEWLVENGHTIGSHTFSHKRLSKLSSAEEKEREIIGSADRIESKLGIKVKHFAYPLGFNESIDLQSLSIIKQRYAYCFSGIRGRHKSLDNDNMLLWRDPANPDLPLNYLRLIAQGGLGIMHKKKRIILTDKQNYTI